MPEQEMAFTARCKNFFGFLPGQSIGDFAKEIKALSDADKAEFVAAFNAMGLPTAMPKTSTPSA